jgi:hypothetical protein
LAQPPIQPAVKARHRFAPEAGQRLAEPIKRERQHLRLEDAFARRFPEQANPALQLRDQALDHEPDLGAHHLFFLELGRDLPHQPEDLPGPDQPGEHEQKEFGAAVGAFGHNAAMQARRGHSHVFGKLGDLDGKTLVCEASRGFRLQQLHPGRRRIERARASAGRQQRPRRRLVRQTDAQRLTHQPAGRGQRLTNASLIARQHHRPQVLQRQVKLCGKQMIHQPAPDGLKVGKGEAARQKRRSDGKIVDQALKAAKQDIADAGAAPPPGRVRQTDIVKKQGEHVRRKRVDARGRSLPECADEAFGGVLGDRPELSPQCFSVLRLIEDRSARDVHTFSIIRSRLRVDFRW